MFGVRARKLREVYRAYPSLDAIPPAARAELEADVLHARLDDIWAETEAFWRERDPAELARAARDGKHRLALVMRWYLGRSSRWAIDGESARRVDFQIWCGPAMGAFNAWTRGSVLADPAHRTVAQIARNLLEGAAVVTRAQQARSHGVPVPARAFNFVPRLFA
jgi:PfaD family protein